MYSSAMLPCWQELAAKTYRVI